MLYQVRNKSLNAKQAAMQWANEAFNEPREIASLKNAGGYLYTFHLAGGIRKYTIRMVDYGWLIQE